MPGGLLIHLRDELNHPRIIECHIRIEDHIAKWLAHGSGRVTESSWQKCVTSRSSLTNFGSSEGTPSHRSQGLPQHTCELFYEVRLLVLSEGEEGSFVR